MYEHLATVLEIKATFGIELIAAYQNNQTDNLKELASNRIDSIVEGIEKLRSSHQDIWMMTYKPFG